jgi:hypothetical protein
LFRGWVNKGWRSRESSTGESSVGTLAQGSAAEVISSSAEVDIHEEKVFVHLDEEKECGAGT